ncbi:N-acetylated-alpha-linked acidic dipeptidase 2 [Ixodes scapularis]
MEEQRLHRRSTPRLASQDMRSLPMSSDFHDDVRFGSMVSRKYCCASGLAISVLGVICGVLLGHFAMKSAVRDKYEREAADPGLQQSAEGAERDMTAFLETYDYEGMLSKLTSMPKLGGTEADKTSAEFIEKLWTSQGLHGVHLSSYKAYLSHPDPVRHSKVSIIDSDGSEVFSIVRKKVGTIEPYLAYSSSTGDSPVVADVVFANYGRPEDFEHLQGAGVQVAGNVVIIRFGRVFRGNKIKQAEKQGAAAVILYPDPADYALEPRRPFPESMSLPGDAVSSGTLALVNGDPLTPIYPATDDAFRIPVKTADLPNIPAFTASFDEAAEILRRMKGPPAPQDWKGDLNISEYRLGPGFIKEKSLKLEVNLRNGLATTYNVIGKIPGDQEPEKLVIVGNHRDAWSPGAFDPVSGTVAVLAMAEAYGRLAQQGWKPRRTLVFCSWGSEEFALVGSQEWVEEHRVQLSHQAVAYLNVDISVQGNGTLEVASTPLLGQLMWDTTKKVANLDKAEVHRGRSTVFDTWLSHSPSYNNPESEARFLDLPSDSDYAPFFHELGIPSVDLRYTCSNLSFDSCLPLYHTNHETEMAYKLIDNNFKFLRAVSQVLSLAAYELAVRPLLAMTVRPYAAALNQSLSELRSLYGTHLKDQRVSTSSLVKAVREFSKAADTIDQQRLQQSGEGTRNINNKLMLVERAFIDIPGILAGNIFRNQPSQMSKHVVFGISANDVNVGTRFTAVKEALVSNSSLVAPLVASLAHHIRMATSILVDDL